MGAAWLDRRLPLLPTGKGKQNLEPKATKLAPRREHHPQGPSQLGRLASCSGSHRLIQAYGLKPIQGPDASWGEDMHACVVSGILPENDADAVFVQRCLDYREKVIGKYCLKIWDNEVQLNAPDGRWGYADFLGSNSNKVGVIRDWKFYRNPLDRQSTWYQLADLAWMYLSWDTILKYVHVGAYNPISDQEYVEEFQRRDIPYLTDTIGSIIANGLTGPFELKPHETICRHCPALGICPAVRTTAEEFRLEMIDKDLKTLPGAILSELGRKSKILEPLAKAILSEIRSRIEAGENVEGWKIWEQAAAREIESLPELVGLMVGKLDVSEILQCAKVAMGKLEEKFTTKREKNVSKAASLAEFNALIQPCLKTKEPVKVLKEVRHAE